MDLVRQVAPTRTNILITGESGTGKELVARSIHSLSERREHAFVAINCGAIPENLLESELFGHVKGSFTGATSNKMGLFEVADGGTLLLDEVGELPLGLQVKLLRAIQDRSFKRVGGTSEVHVDLRILSATNKNLEHEVRASAFREDLFYRLNVIEICLPPLRDRVDDVALLADHFVRRFAREIGNDVREIDPAALSVLERYHFPGNVRELENVIERAVTLSHGSTITVDSLPQSVMRRPEPIVGGGMSAAGVDLEELLARYERSLLLEALELASGVKKRAAKLLGVSFRSFRYRLEKLSVGEADSD
jgi:two-component system response regulator PilR (NtrC family)